MMIWIEIIIYVVTDGSHVENRDIMIRRGLGLCQYYVQTSATQKTPSNTSDRKAKQANERIK